MVDRFLTVGDDFTLDPQVQVPASRIPDAATVFATAAQGVKADSALQPDDATAFATAAQGALADSAVQPGALSVVATSGAYVDLNGLPVYDVRKHGTFTEGSTAAVNAATLQAANDACAAFGGGTVVIPPGVFECVGVIQDARVNLHGPGATLKHPTGDGTDIIRSRTYLTTGSIASGSKTLTVASATGIEVGAVIGIRAGDGYSSIQFAELTAGIDASQTTGITVDDATGFPSNGHMVVDSEVIAYAGMSGADLTGVTRGAYGTTAASHSSGAFIGTAARLVAEVVAVSGTTITLDRPSGLTLTAAPVQTGILHPAITGLRFDGQRPVGGPVANTRPVKWTTVRFGTIRDVRVVRGESALYFDQGTRDCVVDNLHADECSVPEASKGAVFWLFQHCHRNKINNLTVTGDLWAGVYLDNRTTTATEWDGPCNGNTGADWTFSVTEHAPFITNTAILITGGNRNVFSRITTRHVRTGFTIDDTSQVYTADASLPGAKNNHIDAFKMEAGNQPYVLSAGGNLVTGLTYEAIQNGINTGVGNIIATSSVAPGGAPTLGAFPDGTQTAPGVAFGSETNTGFYKIATGQVQFVSQSALVMRLRSTGVLFADGKNIELTGTTGTMLGTGSTQKLGFWGATPVVRPANNADTSGADLASLETEVNELKALLRTVGLMAAS